MGMIGYLREVSDADLQIIEEGANDIAKAYRFFDRDDSVALCLEKDWQAMHYLLTGESWGGTGALAFLLTGGREVGASRGYDPPRLLDHEFVQQLHTALQSITDEELGSRFDAEKFEAEDIYPGNWGDEPIEETRDLLVGVFQEVREYVARVAASHGQIVIAIT